MINHKLCFPLTKITSCSLDESFYTKAIEYYNKTLAVTVGATTLYPLFWIESDDIKWEAIQRWVARNPQDFRLPNSDDTLLKTFHRFVVADGVVMSHSSLSFSAAYLSTAVAPLVVAGELCYGTDPLLTLRKDFLLTPRFIAINATKSSPENKL
jgi:hypothetical protein